MRNRMLAMFLVLTLLTPTLVACSKSPESSDTPAAASKVEIFVEGLLDVQNPRLEKEGVSLTASSVQLDEPIKATIAKVSGPPPLFPDSDIIPETYDFKLDGPSQLIGVLTLTLPLNVKEGELPGAAYLNESSGEWEAIPFQYDPESKSIQISTDHLSKYGVFSVAKEGGRRAHVEFLGLFGEAEDQDFLGAIEEYTQNGLPMTQCIDIGANAASDALALGSDFLGNIAQSAGYLAYGEDVMSTLGDKMGSLGLLLSVVQISNNIYNGKTHEAVVGSMKTAYTYILGKVVSKLSNSVLSASMASVAIIDYSINKFGTEALAGRASLYRDAYTLYYQKGNDGYKSSAYWYQLFYPYFAEGKFTEEQLRAEIDGIVTEHAKEFWTGTNKLGIDYYVSEAREKFKWTAAEAGLNDGVRNEISAERRAILFNDILPGVFQQIAYKINLENERKLRAEYQALSKYLNQTIQFSVKDEKKLYADHPVRFAPLNDKATIENWTGKFKSDGSLSTSFTLYGHMYAGAPHQLKIFKPNADLEKDEPLRVIEFKVTPPEVEIVLGEEIGGLQYAQGDHSKIMQVGLDAAFKQAQTINVAKDGSFTLEVDYASASGGSGNDKFTSEIRGLVLSGKLDPGTLEGKGTLTASTSFNRKEISPMEAMEGETKEYITSTIYDDTLEGTLSIKGSDGKVTFSIQLQGTRAGYTKLQYHSIDPQGVEFWGDKPTITDKSGEISGSGSYQFTVLSK